MLPRIRCIILILFSIYYFIPVSVLSSTPERIQHTNISENQITISWVTTSVELSKINYGTTPALGISVTDNIIDDVHHITLTGLLPDTIYYYDIISGGITYNNNGKHYTFKTSRSISVPPIGSDFVYGKVVVSDGITPAEGAVVYLQLWDNDNTGSPDKSAVYSVRVGPDGYWFANLVNFRTKDNNTPFEYSIFNDKLYIYVEGGMDGNISRVIDIPISTPAEVLILSSDKTPPYITDCSPGEDAEGISPETSISLHIKDDLSGVDKSSIIMKINDKIVIPQVTGNTKHWYISYTPSLPFDWGEIVKVEIIAYDIAGNYLNEIYSFTINNDIEPPYTLYHYPDKNATNVAVNSLIMFHLLDDISGVDISSIVIKVNNKIISPVITGHKKDYTIVYNPQKNFRYGEKINVSIIASDLNKLPNTLYEEYSFITIPDKAPPYIVDRYPPENATYVRVDTNIIIYLRDDLAGIDRDSIVMTVDGEVVKPNIIGVASYFILLYTPDKKFDYSHEVEITIRAKDLALPPNTMRLEKYSFTTIPDIEPPYTTNHTPGKGATGVDINTPVVFHIIDDGVGVNRASIIVKINGIKIRPEIMGTKNNYRIYYKPPAGWRHNTQFYVSVNAEDLAGNIMPREEYTFITKSTRDTEPPYTDNHFPEKYATNVPVNSRIIVHIKDDGVGVNPGSIIMKINNIKVTPEITGIMSDYRIVYQPDTNFEYNEKVKVTIEAEDMEGNKMIPDIYTFTTCDRPDLTPPYVDSHMPDKGENNVSISTPIVFYIKDDDSGVDKTSITLQVNGVKVNPVITGDISGFKVVYQPSEPFEYNIVVKIIINARDIAGNAMPEEAYTFTTENIRDTIPPYTIAHLPGKDSTDVPVNTTITLQIRDDASGVDKLSIGMKVKGRKVTPVITGDMYCYTVSYKPEVPFGYAQTIDVIITAKDIAGNVMPQDKYRFTTEMGIVDTTPPYTTAHQPPKDATDVDIDTTIVVHIKDDGMGVDKASIEMVVNNKHVPLSIKGNLKDMIISYEPINKFEYNKEIHITIKAKDLAGNIMPDDVYSFKTVSEPPIDKLSLVWAGETGYEDDGINPDKCKVKTRITYKIKYIDPDNIPPKGGYPKLYIYLDNRRIKIVRMSPVDTKDRNYQDGVIYWYRYTITRIGNYSYKFEAINQKKTIAIGKPTEEHQGPEVTTDNAPPRLEYFYPNSGVNIQAGNMGSIFEYRVIYYDEDNDMPKYGYPRLYITMNGRAWKPLRMKPEDYRDMNVVDGKVYTFVIPKLTPGVYTYRFEAIDSKGLKATGDSTQLREGPQVTQENTPPSLELGFDTTGVMPTEGNRRTVFEFQVRYIDMENNPPLPGHPKLCLYRNGKRYIVTGMIPVDRSDNDYTDGRIYTLKKALYISGEYQYKFYAMDVTRTIVETPEYTGPVVSILASVERNTSEDIGFVYPNPAYVSDNIFFYGIEYGRLQIYNIVGELIFNGTYTATDGWKPPQDIATGIYIYRIKSTQDSNWITGKFGIIK
jgi:hypothetical protein